MLSDGVVELRPIQRRDLDSIKRAAKDPAIRRRFGLLKDSPTEYFERYRKLARDERGAAFTVSDVDGECLGLVSFEWRDAGRVELGYWLLPEGRGRGRATRALWLLSRWVLDQPGVERVELSTSPDNVVSQHVAERCGFRREGTLRSYHVVDRRREDAVIFSLLAEDLDSVSPEVPPSESVKR
jgi:RimJ/RimL family protein N-acetyltransferase